MLKWVKEHLNITKLYSGYKQCCREAFYSWIKKYHTFSLSLTILQYFQCVCVDYEHEHFKIFLCFLNNNLASTRKWVLFVIQTFFLVFEILHCLHFLTQWMQNYVSNNGQNKTLCVAREGKVCVCDFFMQLW